MDSFKNAQYFLAFIEFAASVFSIHFSTGIQPELATTNRYFNAVSDTTHTDNYARSTTVLAKRTE